MKKRNLEWYAFYQYGRELRHFNVLYDDLIEKVEKALKKSKNYQEIREIVRTCLFSMYMGRCEYEVLVKNWTGYDLEEKIDVYYQLEPNIDRITEYLITNLAPRKKNKILEENVINDEN